MKAATDQLDAFRYMSIVDLGSHLPVEGKIVTAIDTLPNGYITLLTLALGESKIASDRSESD